jgi:hypothetical protein
MSYLRSLLSLLSAPILYGIVCVPALGFIYGLFPGLLDEQGGTRHVPLLLATELLQFLILFLCGYIAARLAPRRIWLHTGLAIALMLVIGVSVQLGFWDAVPVWHHFVFFASIAIGMSAGAYLRDRQLEAA